MPVGLIGRDNMHDKIANLMNSNSEVQRKRRYKQMAMEETAAQKLRIAGWKVFSPTVVCDRIGVKDGEVFFIEFKKRGQKLTQNQGEVKELAKDRYIIVDY